MSIYKAKSGKWKVDIWFEGKKIHTKSFSNKLLAQKYEREKIYELESNLLASSQNKKSKEITYNEMYLIWLDASSKRKKIRSLTKDAQMHRDYVEPIIGNLHNDDITKTELEKIIEKILSKGLSKSSANLVIQHFCAVFNYCFTHEYITRNPARNFSQLKINVKEMDFLSSEEVDQLLSFTNSKYSGDVRWRHIFYLALFTTGCRLGELLALQWDQIDFSNETILICQSWNHETNQVDDSTKSSKDRRVPLHPLLKAELGSYRNENSKKFIFSNDGEKPMCASSFRRWTWYGDLKKAGVRKIRIHDSRHTYSSNFMMNDGNVFDLKKVLGHSNIKTTERYAHLSANHLSGLRNIIKINYSTKNNLLKGEFGKVDSKSSPSDHSRVEKC